MRLVPANSVTTRSIISAIEIVAGLQQVPSCRSRIVIKFSHRIIIRRHPRRREGQGDGRRSEQRLVHDGLLQGTADPSLESAPLLTSALAFLLWLVWWCWWWSAAGGQAGGRVCIYHGSRFVEIRVRRSPPAAAAGRAASWPRGRGAGVGCHRIHR